jgi:hypothetical protein
MMLSYSFFVSNEEYGIYSGEQIMVGLSKANKFQVIAYEGDNSYLGSLARRKIE